MRSHGSDCFEAKRISAYGFDCSETKRIRRFGCECYQTNVILSYSNDCLKAKRARGYCFHTNLTRACSYGNDCHPTSVYVKTVSIVFKSGEYVAR